MKAADVMMRLHEWGQNADLPCEYPGCSTVTIIRFLKAGDRLRVCFLCAELDPLLLEAAAVLKEKADKERSE